MIIVRKNYMNKKPAHLRKVEPVVFYSICDVPIFLNRAYLCSVSYSSESIRFFSKVLPLSSLRLSNIAPSSAFGWRMIRSTTPS